MQIKKRFVSIAFTLLLIIIIGCFAVHSHLASSQGQPVVTAVKAERMPLDIYPNSSGKLEAWETANVVSQATGKVGEILVDLGSTVKAGDVLLTLENNQLAASEAQAKAALAAAHSSRELALIDYQVQKLNYERNKVLVDNGALSQSDFDNKIALPFAKAEELALHGSIAQVQQAEANLQLAEANYANSIIVSPISGVVTAKSINTGELANPSITLFSLANLDKMMVMTSVGEDEINKIKTRMQVPVLVEAVSNLPITGIVTNIASALTPTTRAYLVKIQLDNPNHVLKPGMIAEVSWTNENHSALVIPREALFIEKSHTYVWTVNDGLVSKREVNTEALNEMKVVVKEGLSIGQEVVIPGQERLQEGMQVTVISTAGTS